jgi:hypothetical protein
MADDVFEGTWRARQSEPSQWKVDRPAPQQAYLRFEPHRHWVPDGGIRRGER